MNGFSCSILLHCCTKKRDKPKEKATHLESFGDKIHKNVQVDHKKEQIIRLWKQKQPKKSGLVGFNFDWEKMKSRKSRKKKQFWILKQKVLLHSWLKMQHRLIQKVDAAFHARKNRFPESTVPILKWFLWNVQSAWIQIFMRRQTGFKTLSCINAASDERMTEWLSCVLASRSIQHSRK